MQDLWSPLVIVAGPNPDAESDPAGTPPRPSGEPQLDVSPAQSPPPMGSKARAELRRADRATREGRGALNPPGHLAAIVSAVKAAAPELEGRVWSGSAPLDPGFPYAVVSGPAEAVASHSSRRGHVSALIEISVFATTSAQASALQWRLGPGVRKPDVAAGVHADYSVDGWGWTGTVALEWRTAPPDGSRVHRRALSFRLILTPKGTLR